MLRDEGHRYCYLTPGNYGNDFLRQTLGYDQELAVKCSNYIGDAIDDGVRLKMDGLLLVGHIGKLVKIAAGVMNTHSRQADARMEVLAVHAAMAGADHETVCALMKCFTTKEALDILAKKRTFGRDDADRDGEDRVSFGEACRREDEGRGADVFG